MALTYEHVRQEDEKHIEAMVQLRCTDKSLASFAFATGICVLFMETLSLCTDNWLETIEPRPTNLTDNSGNYKGSIIRRPILQAWALPHIAGTFASEDTLFIYNSGYFTLCRERLVPENETLTDMERIYFYSSETSQDFNRTCVWNPFFSQYDLSNLSRTTSAIMMRIQICAFIHVAGLILSTVAIIYSILGHRAKDSKTLISGITYVGGGLCICIAVMQYICVVDDEMTPRMKPTAAGEPSKYNFKYGYSFLSGSISFMLLQICAVCNLFLFFRRYPTMEDKMSIVPGLREKVRRVQLQHAAGTPVMSGKRGSLPGVNHSPGTHTPSPFEIQSFLLDKV